MAFRTMLKKGFAEFVLIVAGVLVALAVDGYATRRAEAAAEVEFLRRVADDLRESEATLEGVRQRAEEQRVLLGDLAGRLSEGQEIPDSTLGDALSRRTYWSVADRMVAAISMQEALESGRLSLLDRPDTRHRLQVMARLWQGWVDVEVAYRRLLQENEDALLVDIDSVRVLSSLSMYRPISATTWDLIDHDAFGRMLRDEIIALGRWSERASVFQEAGRSLVMHLDSIR